MKCRQCETPAVIKMPRHNIALCPRCFDIYVRGQVEKAIHDGKMFRRDEPVMVAVSGGKDSLALWDLLIKLGYRTAGLHLNLGIGDYSALSQKKVEDFAQVRGAELIIHAYQEAYGLGVIEIAEETARPACSACGTMKRYHFNRIAMERGFPVVATGHNLDDEASRLLGNVLQWQESYLEKQSPVLSDEGGTWARKVKPLYRLAERELAAYAVVHRIDYIVEECPMSKGAKTLLYKEVLNKLEEASPGTKHRFYLGFLGRERAAATAPPEGSPQACRSCGQPTQGAVCSFCRLMERVAP
ncbi:MAG: adenine nucleotide alpha hydrolase family protein [Nitrospirae bacterium]|nr:adenine nucleotide alpha hydrolase family protein [Candidatus Manganitrophaceae bacterium]